MKRIVALLLALMVALLLPALGESDADAVETVEEAAETVEEAAETAEEAAKTSAPPSIIKKLVELPWYVWAILAALVLLAVVLLASARKTAWTSRRIAMGAMCISIAFVLSCIRLYRMPQGGSITPASMLPLILFMVACGPLQGFVVGCTFGLLKLIADPYIIHPVQMLVDYPLAYGAMILGCLACCLPGKKSADGSGAARLPNAAVLPVAALLGGIARYLMSVLSGVVFFAESAGEQNAIIYSLVYNITYMGPDIAVCVLVACIPGMYRLVEILRGKN